MATSTERFVKSKSPAQVYSQQILKRFSNSLDCLTAHLLLECSEVLAGVKPANLISLVNRSRPCGRNLYQLWQSHHEELSVRIANLNFMLLKSREQSLLLLCYNRDHLERHLAHAGIRTLLHKAGYETNISCEQLLSELRRRIERNDSFPHEIGLFIGYPAKDVAAFMGMVNLSFTCQGPWRIYGNPSSSLDLADRYRCCRHRMGAILATGNRTALELDNPEHPFFCNIDDNDCQYHTTRP